MMRAPGAASTSIASVLSASTAPRSKSAAVVVRMRSRGPPSASSTVSREAPKPDCVEKLRQRCRSVAVGGQRENARTRLQMRADEIERAAMQREQHGFRQRPAEPRRGQAERRRRRHNDHLLRIDVSRQHRADAVVKRIAGGEHADLPAAIAQHLVGRAVERARPRPRRAANERSGKAEVAPAAEHDLGGADQPARRRAQALDAVLADADDGQPARRCGSLSARSCQEPACQPSAERFSFSAAPPRRALLAERLARRAAIST